MKRMRACDVLLIGALAFTLAFSQPAWSSDKSNLFIQNETEPELLVAAAGKRTPATSAGAAAASMVDGVVKTDGAMVYSRPDFDSDVVATLSKGQKVRVNRAAVGGDMGRFYKLRVQGQVGYIADIDVEVVGGAMPIAKAPATGTKKKTSAKRTKQGESQKEADSAKNKKSPRRRQLPIYFSRYVGVLIGQSGYRENISGVDSNTTMSIYGLKVTGPDVLIDGPVIDFSVALHYGAPSYYDSLSTTKPAGFIMLTDALLLLPFMHGDNALAYLGAGPLLALSNIQTTTAGTPRTLTSFNLGASFSLGGAVRFDKLALRLEAKYFWEKQTYQALQAAIQTEF